MIIPAILENSFEEIRKKLAQIDNVARLVQIDIADGKLVAEKSFLDIQRLNELDALAKLELHLMVENPTDYVKTKIQNVIKVSAHVEAESIPQFIKTAKKLGYEVGLSINPETPLEKLDAYVPGIDFVQFLGVTPGAQGHPFQENTLKKIADFKKAHPDMCIQADGGITQKNIQKLKGVGVENFIIGTEIVKTENPREAYLQFDRII